MVSGTVLVERTNPTAVRHPSPTHIHTAYLLFSIIAVTSLVAEYYHSLTITVRLHGTNFMLESYNYDSQVWMPVCAENWDNNYGMAACELMGYNR